MRRTEMYRIPQDIGHFSVSQYSPGMNIHLTDRRYSLHPSQNSQFIAFSSVLAIRVSWGRKLNVINSISRWELVMTYSRRLKRTKRLEIVVINSKRWCERV